MRSMIYNAPIIDRTLEPRVTQSLACAPAGRADVATDPLSWSTVSRPLSDANQANELHGYFSMEPQEVASADHSNQQYSITAVTTSAGAVAERYAYSAYGEPTVLDGSGTVIASSAINNRYSYTGREWDATTGLHHFRARWLSPKTGRFLGRDPIGYVELSLSEYVASNPLFYVDPSGLMQITSETGVQDGPKYIPIPPGRPKKPHQPTNLLNPQWPLPQHNYGDPWSPTPAVAPRTPKAICDSFKGFTACANCAPSCEQTMQDLFGAVSKHWSTKFPDNCGDWVYTFPKPKKNGGCYTLTGQSYLYPLTGLPGTDHRLRHVVIVVTLCNGNKLIIDSGWWSWMNGNPMEQPNNIFPAVPQSTFPI